METKYVGDKFEIFVTDDSVIIILNLSPSKNHQQNDVTNTTETDDYVLVMADVRFKSEVSPTKKIVTNINATSHAHDNLWSIKKFQKFYFERPQVKILKL